jgi:hypothetical protein
VLSGTVVSQRLGRPKLASLGPSSSPELGHALTGLNPQRMVTRGVTGIRVDPNVEKSVPIADLRAVYARHCAPADRPNQNTRSVVRQNIGGARQKLSQ